MSEKTAAVRTFSFLLVTLAIYFLIWQFLCVRMTLPVYYYARLVELLGIFLFVALALFTPMHFEKMGILVPRGVLFRSLALGGGVALLTVCVLALGSAVMGHEPLVSLTVRGDISHLTYFLVAPLQEVLAKSVMYHSFESVLGEEHPVLVVGLSSLVFGIFHVVYGFSMMLLAMALSVLTGWMFRRVRCVWGCALTHFACGFFPICFGF